MKKFFGIFFRKLRGISVFALFRSGFGVAVPILFVAYGISIVSGKIVEISDAFGFLNKWIGFAFVLGGFLALFLFIGILAEETSLIDFLRRKSEARPSLLLFVNFVFGRGGKSAGFYEVLCYFSETMRVRGIVTEEIFGEDGTVWCVVHFSAAPTPFMGNLLEVRKDALIETGNASGGYVAYVMSYGASHSK